MLFYIWWHSHHGIKEYEDENYIKAEEHFNNLIDIIEILRGWGIRPELILELLNINPEHIRKDSANNHPKIIWSTPSTSMPYFINSGYKPNMSADFYAKRGYIRILLEKFEESVGDYKEAIELDPKYLEAYIHQGNSAFFSKKYEDAIATYTKVIESKENCIYNIAPDNRDGNNHQPGVYDTIIMECGKTIEINQTTMGNTMVKQSGRIIEINQAAAAYYNRALAYRELGKYDKAITDFNIAIEYSPENAVAYYSRALAYEKLGKYDKAITDFNIAIKYDPENAVTYYSRGIIYEKLRKYDKAITDFNTAIEYDPENVSAYHSRGIAYRKLREYDKAITDFTKAIEYDPENAPAYYSRGITYRKLREYGKATIDLTYPQNFSTHPFQLLTPPETQ